MVVGLMTMAVEHSYSFPPHRCLLPSVPDRAAILAAGITGLQVAANPYVDLLGGLKQPRAGWISPRHLTRSAPPSPRKSEEF